MIKKCLSVGVLPLYILKLSDGDLIILLGVSGPSDNKFFFFGELLLFYFNYTLLLKSGVSIVLFISGNLWTLGLALYLGVANLFFSYGKCYYDFFILESNGDLSFYFSLSNVSLKKHLILSLIHYSLNISLIAGLRCSLHDKSFPTRLYLT